MIVTMHGMSTMYCNCATEVRLAAETGYQGIELFERGLSTMLDGHGRRRVECRTVSRETISISIVSAIIAGIAGYIMTDGWTALAIGLSGATGGPIVYLSGSWVWRKWQDRKLTKLVLLDGLQRQMLTFILSLVGKRPVTTSDIYTHEPFLEVGPGELHQAFIHLRVNEYIVAEEDPGNNPLAPPSAHRFKVQAVTKEGIAALRSR